MFTREPAGAMGLGWADQREAPFSITLFLAF